VFKNISGLQFYVITRNGQVHLTDVTKPSDTEINYTESPEKKNNVEDSYLKFFIFLLLKFSQLDFNV
jgi:hypothetical protein